MSSLKKCFACLKPIKGGVLCEEHARAYADGMRRARASIGGDTEKLQAEAQARYDAHLKQLTTEKKGEPDGTP